MLAEETSPALDKSLSSLHDRQWLVLVLQLTAETALQPNTQINVH